MLLAGLALIGGTDFPIHELISRGVSAAEEGERLKAEAFIAHLFASSDRVDRRTFIEKAVEWLSQKTAQELAELRRVPAGQRSAALTIERAIIEHMRDVKERSVDAMLVRKFLLSDDFKRRVAATAFAAEQGVDEGEDHRQQRRVYDLIRRNTAEL